MKKLLILGLLTSLMTNVACGTTEQDLLSAVGLPLAEKAVETFFPELFSLASFLEDPNKAVQSFTETLIGKVSWKTATDEELQAYLNQLNDGDEINELSIRKFLNDQSAGKKLANLKIADAVLSQNPTTKLLGDITKTALGTSNSGNRLGNMLTNAKKLVDTAKKQ